LSASLSAMLTGITEPLEFTFLFVAPLLYVVHCIFAGLSFMLMHILNVGVGMTFSGGFIDLLLFGILQGNQKTRWIWIAVVGIIYFFLYYFVFMLLIKKLNLKTPGREDSGEAEIKLYTRADMNQAKEKRKKDTTEADNERMAEIDARSAMIVRGLGGRENISDVDCCITRLRITVNDSEKVDRQLLKQTGASGVLVNGNAVQIVYGPQVTVIRSDLEAYLKYASTEKTDMEAGGQKGNQERIASDNKKEAGEPEIVYAPLRGKAVQLEEMNDGVFSEGMIGPGITIAPDDGNVYAPFDGSVGMIFETRHALGLLSNAGTELLIHMGIDTVQLKGQGFEIFVSEGEQFQKGKLLAKMDLHYLKEAGYSAMTPVVVTNSDMFEKVEVLRTGRVDEQSCIMKIY